MKSYIEVTRVETGESERVAADDDEIAEEEKSSGDIVSDLQNVAAGRN